MQESKQLVDWVITKLEKESDPGRRAKSTTYCPTSMQVIGVSNPAIYGLIRELKMEHQDWDEGQWIGFSLDLARSGVFECRGIAFELIGRNKNLLECMTRKDLSVLGKGLDNWASVDHFAVGIHGVLWRMGTVTDKDIDLLLASTDPWKRRIAVVSTVSLNLKSRGGTGDTARTLNVCEAVVRDHHDMIQKALSWALRELSKRDPGVVDRFMKQHHKELAGRVIREVRHKLDFGTKN